MIEAIKYRLWSVKHWVGQIPQRLTVWLAWRLPRRLAYWAAVRVAAYASVGKEEWCRQNPYEISVVDMLQRWCKK